jgi:hypothetical protein
MTIESGCPGGRCEQPSRTCGPPAERGGYAPTAVERQELVQEIVYQVGTLAVVFSY